MSLPVRNPFDYSAKCPHEALNIQDSEIRLFECSQECLNRNSSNIRHLESTPARNEHYSSRDRSDDPFELCAIFCLVDTRVICIWADPRTVPVSRASTIARRSARENLTATNGAGVYHRFQCSRRPHVLKRIANLHVQHAVCRNARIVYLGGSEPNREFWPKFVTPIISRFAQQW
jgi:hypothetical protein